MIQQKIMTYHVALESAHQENLEVAQNIRSTATVKPYNYLNPPQVQSCFNAVMQDALEKRGNHFILFSNYIKKNDREHGSILNFDNEIIHHILIQANKEKYLYEKTLGHTRSEEGYVGNRIDYFYDTAIEDENFSTKFLLNASICILDLYSHALKNVFPENPQRSKHFATRAKTLISFRDAWQTLCDEGDKQFNIRSGSDNHPFNQCAYEPLRLVPVK